MSTIAQQVEALAREVAVHPSWGLAHCLRVEALAIQIAEAERMIIDPVLMHIAALLHDFGAYPPYRRDGVDHAQRSVEFAGEYLAGKGLPAENVRRVQAIIAGHMFYSTPDTAIPEAIAFHDADVLDFLGAIGIARIYGIVGVDDWAKDMTEANALLHKFRLELPGKLILPTAKLLSADRVQQMDSFFAALHEQSCEGRYL